MVFGGFMFFFFFSGIHKYERLCVFGHGVGNTGQSDSSGCFFFFTLVVRARMRESVRMRVCVCLVADCSHSLW
jgi:hypothetical protein